MDKFKIKAKENFKNRRYKDAIEAFSMALTIAPFDLDSKIGLMIADLASENELEAKILFDLYESAKRENIGGIDRLIEGILKESDLSSDFIESEIVVEEILVENIGNYIEYKDFKSFFGRRGEFKVAFEDLMFSTKLVIKQKDDFIEFITLLIENGYTKTALNYIESALLIYPNEKFFKDKLFELESKIA